VSALADVAGQDRLLAFEVAGSLYALPIGCVVEVGEVAPLACIPSLPERVGGVMNHHGDALPVIQRGVLLGVDEDSLAEPAHVLAVTARVAGGPRLGVPVDRIVGFIDGAPATARGEGPVAERRVADGRVLFVLDPQRLVARAKNQIEHSLARGE
jgi:chemotaxis signal transduction protein